MEIQSSCRVCMKTDINLFDIFAKPFGENGPPSLAEILTKLTKYKVDRDDKLSHKICAECLKWGRNSHRFCTTAEESYYTASQILGINLSPVKSNSADQNIEPQIESNERIQIPEIFTIIHNTNKNGTKNTYPKPLEKRNSVTNDLNIKIEEVESSGDEIVEVVNANNTNNTKSVHSEKRNSFTNDLNINTEGPLCSDEEIVPDVNTKKTKNTNSMRLEKKNSFTTDLNIKTEELECSDDEIFRDVNENETNNTNSVDLEKRNCSTNDLNINTEAVEPSNCAKDPLLTNHDEASINIESSPNEGELSSSTLSQHQHTRIENDGKISYICTICQEIFQTLFNLQKHRLIKHLRRSTDPGIYYDCRLCGFSHSSKSGLKNHLKYAHKLEVDLDEEVKKSMVHHEQPKDTRVLENITPLDSKCTLCRKKYSIPINLRNHILYRHLDQNNENINNTTTIVDGNILDVTSNTSLKCNICNASFGKEYLLQKHRLVSHLRVSSNFAVEQGVNYDCKICGWSFGRKSSILHHLRTFHRQIGNLDSDLEKSKIINEQYYNDNRLLENTIPLDQSCCTCKKAFSDLFLLKKHILYTHIRYENKEGKNNQGLPLTLPKKKIKLTKPVKTAIPSVRKKSIVKIKSKHQSDISVQIQEKYLSIIEDDSSVDSGNNSFEHMFSPLINHTTSKNYRNSTPKITKKRGPYKKRNSLPGKEPVNNPEPDKEGLEVCNICKKSFETLFDLQKHRFVTHLRTYKKNSTNKTIFICTICGYDYGTRCNFEAHLRDFHKKTNNLREEIKASKFNRLENWNDISLLDNITDIDLNCVTCGRQFKEPLILKYHVLYSHLNSTDLTVVGPNESRISNQNEVMENGANETNESQALLTIIKVESEEMCLEPNVSLYNSYNASINKTLNSKRSLADMQEDDKTEEEVDSGPVHRSKRLKVFYECEVCLKPFPKRGQKNYHLAYAHKEIKLYECPICHKKYNHQKFLNAHVNKFHHGAKFTCEDCSLEFVTVRKLKAHKIQAHSMVPQRNVLKDEIDNVDKNDDDNADDDDDNNANDGDNDDDGDKTDDDDGDNVDGDNNDDDDGDKTNDDCDDKVDADEIDSKLNELGC